MEGLGLALGYNSGEADLISDFYLPCLEVAEKYDRAVGYFRSSTHLSMRSRLSATVGSPNPDCVLRGWRDCLSNRAHDNVSIADHVSGFRHSQRPLHTRPPDA